MSHKMKTERARKIIMSAMEKGVAVAADEFGLSRTRIKAICSHRDHLATVFMFEEIRKHKGFKALQDCFRKEYRKVL